MKFIIISDSHGNITNIKLISGFAKKIKAKALIHCGDWDNLKSVEEVVHSSIPVYTVLGNADIHSEIKDMLEKKAKKFNVKYLKLKLGGKRIGVIHNIKDLVISNKLDIIFCGHRHFKSERIINGIKVISPGALHSVKSSFAVYDTGTNGVEFFDLQP